MMSAFSDFWAALERENARDHIKGLEAELAEMRRADGWIAIEDGLPEQPERWGGYQYLVYTSGDRILVATFHKWYGTTDWELNEPLPENEFITHWMLLPDPPKKQEEGQAWAAARAAEREEDEEGQ